MRAAGVEAKLLQTVLSTRQEFLINTPALPLPPLVVPPTLHPSLSN